MTSVREAVFTVMKNFLKNSDGQAPSISFILVQLAEHFQIDPNVNLNAKTIGTYRAEFLRLKKLEESPQEEIFELPYKKVLNLFEQLEDAIQETQDLQTVSFHSREVFMKLCEAKYWYFTQVLRFDERLKDLIEA